MATIKLITILLVAFLITLPLGGIEIATGRRYGYIRDTRLGVIKSFLWLYAFVMNSRFSFVYGAVFFFLSPLLFILGMVLSYTVMFYQIWRDEAKLVARSKAFDDPDPNFAVSQGALFPQGTPSTVGQMAENFARARSLRRPGPNGPEDSDQDIGLSPLHQAMPNTF